MKIHYPAMRFVDRLYSSYQCGSESPNRQTALRATMMTALRLQSPIHCASSVIQPNWKVRSYPHAATSKHGKIADTKNTTDASAGPHSLWIHTYTNQRFTRFA